MANPHRIVNLLHAGVNKLDKRNAEDIEAERVIIATLVSTIQTPLAQRAH